MPEEENWRQKTLFWGAVLGALTGLGAAYILLQRAEKRGERVKLEAREGVKLGLGLLGLLRQVGELGKGGE